MKRPNLYDWLKIIAILTMIVDHLGYTFFPDISWLRLIGRIAFPIFLFLVWFNWNYKRRWDLLIWAIIVQIPIFVMGFGFDYLYPSLNILIGIVLWRVVLWWIDKLNIKGNKWLVSISLLTVVLLILNPYIVSYLDYGSFVISFPLLWYLFKKFYKNWIFNLLYSVGLFCFFWLFTYEIFNFNFISLVILAMFYILLLCIFFLIWQENHSISIWKKWNKILMWLSQKALYIYVFHLVLFWLIKVFYLWKWL